MEFDAGFSPQCSQNSCSDLDDLLDLNKPPSVGSFTCPLPKKSYSSQLILSKNTQGFSDIDSGFEFTSSDSSGCSQQSLNAFEFVKNRKAFSSQSTASDESFSLLDASLMPVRAIDASEQAIRSEFSQEDGLPCWEKQCYSERLKTLSQSLTLSQDESQGAIGFDNRSLGEQYFQNERDQVPRKNQIERDTQSDCSDYEDDSRIKRFRSSNFDELTLDSVDGASEVTQSVSDSVPSEIDPIYNMFAAIKSQHSDNAFVYALAANLCKDVYPKHMNITLKTALLLSIVSCNDQPISIIAITRGSDAATAIMTRIGKLANRFICVSDDLKFNGKCSKTATIEANSLLLARGGVCYIGDWLGLKPSSLKYLQNVVDSGSVIAQSSSNVEFALKCAIWMHWSCSATKMYQSQKDLSIISSLFGIPVILDESASDDIVEFLLTQCSSESIYLQDDDGFNIDDEAIKAYLNIVSNMSTVFDDEALALLKTYFIVTRSVRPKILSPRSFEVLQRLSECHAKLCFRSTVLKNDVMFAIELFEQFVLSLFAGQVMTKPMPNSSARTFEEVDENMLEFELWLQGYLAQMTFFDENE